MTEHNSRFTDCVYLKTFFAEQFIQSKIGERFYLIIRKECGWKRLEDHTIEPSALVVGQLKGIKEVNM
jgi:hypothetical protein